MSYYCINERERTLRLINADLLPGCELTAQGNPQLAPAAFPDPVPTELVGFNEAWTCKDPEHKGLHFFLDDYQFERIWRQPESYLAMLQRHPLILGPDFSLYSDYPEPVQRWNHYRNQLLTAWMQSFNLPVIPTASWSTPDSFAWCFDGLPEGGAVAVSTVGCLVHKDARQGFVAGLQELVRQKRPQLLVVYGKYPEPLQLAASSIPGVRVYPHGMAARMGRS